VAGEKTSEKEAGMTKKLLAACIKTNGTNSPVADKFREALEKSK